MHPVIDILHQHLPRLKATYALQALGVIGSYSRDEATANSDLDIVYETQPNTHLNLHSFLSLQKELHQITHLKIDLMNRKYINDVVWLTAQNDIVYV